jgi:hypothetical protein
MKSARNRIETYDDLKRHTATLGMVLAGITVGQTVPDQERHLNTGLELCDVVAQVGRLETERLRQTSVESTFEEAAFIDRFYRTAETTIRHPEKLRELEERAPVVRRILERLLHLERVPQNELKQTSQFSHLVYDTF